MNHKREYLVCLALVLFNELSEEDRDGLTRSEIWRMKKADLDGFINAVYQARWRDMWPGDFQNWWMSVNGAAVRAWRGV